MLKRTKIITFVFLIIVIFQFTVQSTPLVIATVAKGILKGVVGSFGAEKVGGFLGDKARGALFNVARNILGLGKPDEAKPVDLSEKALDEIRNIMHTEIEAALQRSNIMEAQAMARSYLRFIEDRYREYMLNVQTDVPFENLIPLLEDLNRDTAFLEEHRAFNSNYDSHYWVNINTYALAASLRLPVLIEMKRRGLRYSKEFIAEQASEMYNKLYAMSRDARRFCTENVTITRTLRSSNPLMLTYTVIDRIGKINMPFTVYVDEEFTPIDEYWVEDHCPEALAYYNERFNYHYDKFGNYWSLLGDLKYLTNVNNFKSWDLNVPDVNNILACYTFSGDMLDASKNKANGTAYGLTYSNGCGVFDGNDYANIPNHFFDPPYKGYETLIIEAKVKMDAPSQYYSFFFSAPAYTVGAHSLNSSNPRATLAFRNVCSEIGAPGGRWGAGPELWYAWDINQPAYYWGWELSPPLFNVSNSVWETIRYEFNYNSSTFSMYRNGVRIYYQPYLAQYGPISRSASHTAAAIGKHYNSYKDYKFKGKIDHLWVYAK